LGGGPPGFRPGFPCPAVLGQTANRRRCRSPTGLSPAPAGRSRTVPLTRVDRARDQSLSPAITSYPLKTAPTGSYALRVWAPPVSLAATPGILSVPQGTEMFQFPRCPLRIRAVTAHHGRRVAPFGDRGITGCQPLPRAFRCVAASFLGCRRQGIHRPPINAELLSLRQTRLRPPRGPLSLSPGPLACAGSRHARPPCSCSLLGMDCVSVCATHDASLLRSHRSSIHAGAHRGIGLPEGQGARMNCQSAVKSWRANGRCGGGFPLAPVEPRGLEPRTSAVQRRRSPS
jgi:hypothetical protein